MNGGLSNSFNFFPLGDSGLLIDFGNDINEKTNGQVLTFFTLLQTARLPWVTDLIPAYSSLAVFYNSFELPTTTEEIGTHYEQVVMHLLTILDKVDNSILTKPPRQMRIPVCYDKMFAPDLEEVATRCDLPVNEVIRLHTSTAFRVYMIGFLPGFAYMGQVPGAIAVSRRSEPRTRVRSGSIGIAGRQTGIYPFDSPGGWQLIGKTPVSLFQKEEASPTLLQPGDEVFFYQITADEFTDYKGRAV